MAKLSFFYAFGVWLAFNSWAFLWTYAAKLLDRPVHGKGVGLEWAPVVFVIPALVCFFGFYLGTFTFGRDPRTRSRSTLRLAAFLFGLVYPLTMVLLRPLFSQMSPGLMPAIVWALVGSFLVAVLFGFLFSRR